MSDEGSVENQEPDAEDGAAADQDAGETRTAEGMEELLDQAEAELSSVDTADGETKSPERFEFGDLGTDLEFGEQSPIDVLSEVDLDLRIELGRTHMRLDDVLKLRSGSVVALDRLAGDPVDVFVNDRLVARGEVLVLNENFCIRVTELVSSGNN